VSNFSQALPHILKREIEEEKNTAQQPTTQQVKAKTSPEKCLQVLGSFVARQQASSSVNFVLSKLRHWMEHYPIVANSVLCFHLWIAGDSLAQYSEHHAALLHHDQHDDITGTSNDTISASKKHQKQQQQPNGQHIPMCLIGTHATI
jgi:hypothetical protein